MLVKVKGDDVFSDYFLIEGNVLDECDSCILMEKTAIHQKHIHDGFTPADVRGYENYDHRHPYVVIIYDDLGNVPHFFEYVEDAQSYFDEHK